MANIVSLFCLSARWPFKCVHLPNTLTLNTGDILTREDDPEQFESSHDKPNQPANLLLTNMSDTIEENRLSTTADFKTDIEYAADSHYPMDPQGTPSFSSDGNSFPSAPARKQVRGTGSDSERVQRKSKRRTNAGSEDTEGYYSSSPSMSSKRTFTKQLGHLNNNLHKTSLSSQADGKNDTEDSDASDVAYNIRDDEASHEMLRSFLGTGNDHGQLSNEWSEDKVTHEFPPYANTRSVLDKSTQDSLKSSSAEPELNEDVPFSEQDVSQPGPVSDTDELLGERQRCSKYCTYLPPPPTLPSEEVIQALFPNNSEILAALRAGHRQFILQMMGMLSKIPDFSNKYKDKLFNLPLVEDELSSGPDDGSTDINEVDTEPGKDQKDRAQADDSHEIVYDNLLSANNRLQQDVFYNTNSTHPRAMSLRSEGACVRLHTAIILTLCIIISLNNCH